MPIPIAVEAIPVIPASIPPTAVSAIPPISALSDRLGAAEGAFGSAFVAIGLSYYYNIFLANMRGEEYWQ